MELQKIILTSIIGLTAGIIGSGTGSSGGILMVSGLIMANIVTKTKMAVGTVLLALLPPLSIGAISAFWREKLINFKIAGVLVISNIIGATIGGYYIASHISDRNSALFNGLFLMLLSMLFFYKYYRNT
jgi:uncharacterized membrane protein YfcA